jgi:ABC-type methionine transport system permease subunit
MKRTTSELLIVAVLWAVTRFVVGGLIGDVASIGILVIGVLLVIERRRRRRLDRESTPADDEAENEKLRRHGLL